MGKTHLICSLLEHFTSEKRVNAVKFITYYDGDDAYHGSELEPLSANFDIREETNISGKKDSSAMLRSGASKVLVVRSKVEHMRDAFLNLRGLLDVNIPVIVESNSLRSIIEPGIFVMLRPEELTDTKNSATRVFDEADIVICMNKSRFDDIVSLIELTDKGWKKNENRKD